MGCKGQTRDMWPFECCSVIRDQFVICYTILLLAAYEIIQLRMKRGPSGAKWEPRNIRVN